MSPQEIPAEVTHHQEDQTDSDAIGLDAIFVDPPSPPSPEPTVAVYEREVRVGDHDSQATDLDLGSSGWSRIEISLVGTHPLWGHHLWNASRAFASYLDVHTSLYRGRRVLELGAGGGLPGIVAALNGARKVVLTDYPDASLIENLRENVQRNVPHHLVDRVAVEGYVWGRSVQPLFDLITNTTDSPSTPESPRFDLIIMSDLIFNHSQHQSLLHTCAVALASVDHSPPTSSAQLESSTQPPPPSLLVFYTHHRPHLAQRDLAFFTLAREQGWDTQQILTQQFPPMFPEDPGDEDVRGTVRGWRLTRGFSLGGSADDGAPTNTS